MKIKICIGSLNIGGAEKQALSFADYLYQKKYDVEVLALSAGKNTLHNKSICPVRVLLPFKGNNRLMNLIHFLSLPFKLREYLSGNEQMVLSTYGDACNVIGFMASLYKKNVSLIWGVRRSHLGGLYSDEWKIYCIEKIGALFNTKVDKIIYNSHAAVKFYKEKFAYSNPHTYVIYNAIDLDRFKNKSALKREKIGLREEAIVIGVFSRVIASKGYLFFIGAFSALKKEHKHLQALIVGPSDKVFIEQLKEKCIALEIDKDIIFSGPREDLQDIYPLIDIYCSPSLSEGTSNVILEAMASEKPCVVTDVGDSRLIVPSENIVVKPADSMALYEGIQQMISRKAHWDEIGQINRQHTFTHFSMSNNFTALEQAYSEKK